MIISNSHKYIFVAIPKTATHAIRFALREHMNDSDWEHVSKYVTRQLPIAGLSHIHHGHLTCKEVKPFISKDNWQTYYKFVICRNPLDRFVSSCFFLYRNGDVFKSNPLEGMRRIISSKKEMARVLLRPQNTFITDDNGELMVDYVGKFEELDNSYRHVCEKVNIPFKSLDSINTNKHDDTASCLDSELKKEIMSFYHDDFELLGYPTI